jgi:hypothetical protein
LRKVVLDLKHADISGEVYRQSVAIDSKWTIRLRPSVSHALTEVAKGLFRMYSHKLQLGITGGQSPYLYQFSEGIARDGIKVLEFSAKDSADEIASTLSDETSFFILVEDHPLTGELFPIDDLIQKISDKKIFTIVLRHHNHLLDSARFIANPYLIEIRDHQQYAAILLGSRSKKIDSLLLVPDLTTYIFSVTKVEQAQKIVMDFESMVAQLAGANLYFTESKNRIWDRVVFSTSQNAEPLYQILKKQIKAGEILCTAKCLQSHPFNFSWWKDDKFSDRSDQHWIIMDLKAIAECHTNFKTFYNEFLALTK